MPHHSSATSSHPASSRGSPPGASSAFVSLNRSLSSRLPDIVPTQCAAPSREGITATSQLILQSRAFRGAADDTGAPCDLDVRVFTAVPDRQSTESLCLLADEEPVTVSIGTKAQPFEAALASLRLCSAESERPSSTQTGDTLVSMKMKADGVGVEDTWWESDVPAVWTKRSDGGTSVTHAVKLFVGVALAQPGRAEALKEETEFATRSVGPSGVMARPDTGRNAYLRERRVLSTIRAVPENV